MLLPANKPKDKEIMISIQYLDLRMKLLSKYINQEVNNPLNKNNPKWPTSFLITDEKTSIFESLIALWKTALITVFKKLTSIPEDSLDLTLSRDAWTIIKTFIARANIPTIIVNANRFLFIFIHYI